MSILNCLVFAAGRLIVGFFLWHFIKGICCDIPSKENIRRNRNKSPDGFYLGPPDV